VIAELALAAVGGFAVGALWRNRGFRATDESGQLRDELTLSRERQRRLIDTAHAGIVIADPSGGVLEANDAYLRLIGFTREEFEQGLVDWRALTPPEWIPADEEAIRQLRAEGKCAPYEKEYLRRDGSRVPVLLVDVMLPGVEDQFAAFALDLSSIRRAETERDRLARQRQVALNAASLGWWALDPATRISKYDERAREIFGVVKGAKAGEELRERIHPEYRPKVAAAVEAALDPKRRAPYEMVYRVVRDDGTIRWVEAHGTVTFEGEGDAARAVDFSGTVEDITERRNADEALRRSERLLREMGEIARVGGWEFDAATGDGTWTDEVARIHGLDPADPTSMQRGLSFYEGDARAQIERAVAEAIGRAKEYDLELELTTAQGERRWVHTIGRPVIEDGKVVRVRGSFQDVTERRLAEEQVRTLAEELERRVVERTAQLEAANRELEAFSYSVSHDLRAPLRGIDGWSAALLEDYGDQLEPRAREYLARVRSETQRMGALIDDLLKLSRINRQEMRITAVDLSALGAEVAENLRRADPERRLPVRIEPRLTADADAGLMRVVLTNLFENAWKFTRRTTEPAIELGCMPGEDERVFFVRDNGVGFDPRYAKNLFAPFQRLHSASEFPGSGIGLATVSRVVNRHGGRVWAESEPGRGATFYFTLGGQR
jgi:PAS domain S-box-containing protein